MYSSCIFHSIFHLSKQPSSNIQFHNLNPSEKKKTQNVSHFLSILDKQSVHQLMLYW